MLQQHAGIAGQRVRPVLWWVQTVLARRAGTARINLASFVTVYVLSRDVYLCRSGNVNVF